MMIYIFINIEYQTQHKKTKKQHTQQNKTNPNIIILRIKQAKTIKNTSKQTIIHNTHTNTHKHIQQTNNNTTHNTATTHTYLFIKHKQSHTQT